MEQLGEFMFGVHSSNIVEMYVMRHGEAEDTGGITGGGLNPSLTQKGREKAKEVSEQVQDLGIEVVVHSGLKRTRETAKVIFDKDKVTVIEERDFREIEHGVMEGMPGDKRNAEWRSYVATETEKWMIENPDKPLPLDFKYGLHPYPEAADQYLFPADPKYYMYDKPCQAENFNQLGERASAAMLKIAKDYRNKRIAVITSNAVMHILIARSQIQKGTIDLGNDGLYPLHFEKSLIGNCAIAKFAVNVETNEIEFVKFLDQK